VKSGKDVSFWVIKLKFNFKSIFIPQNRQILAKNGTSYFFPQKTLNTAGAQESSGGA